MCRVWPLLRLFPVVMRLQQQISFWLLLGGWGWVESGAEGGLGVCGSRTAPSNELCLFTKQLTHSPAHTCLSVDSSLALGLCRTLRLQGNYCQQENPPTFSTKSG